MVDAPDGDKSARLVAYGPLCEVEADEFFVTVRHYKKAMTGAKDELHAGGRRTVLSKECRIPIRNITSIEFSPPTIARFGRMRFNVVGGQSHRALALAGLDENVVDFERQDSDLFVAIREFVEGRIA